VLEPRPCEVTRSGAPRRGLGAVVAAGVAMLLLIAGFYGPRSAESARAPDASAQRPRGPAPRIQGLPESTVDQGPAASEPQNAQSSALLEELQRQALREAEERRKQAAARRRSKSVLFDAAPAKEEKAVRAPAAGTGVFGFSPQTAEPVQPSREERFAQEAAVEAAPSVRAQRLAHPSSTVPEGTLIPAVLETAIQSDLPGMIRAVVSGPVRAFDGTPAIPRGSALIGRYQSGLVRGQTRLFVIWTRLLRPDGVSVALGSPGTDALGRAGLAGELDTHFFEIFGSSVLLSLLDGGAQIAAARAQRNDGGVFIQSGGDDLGNAAEIALQNRIQIPPTIRIPAGTSVQVFVAKDLDFAVPASAP
jgi:type IV secretory pathway VirB10-like protein